VDDVAALAGRLDDIVAEAVDDIDVVAGEALEDVGAAAAVEIIVAIVAEQALVDAVADDDDRSRPGLAQRRQSLDLLARPKREAAADIDDVVAAAGDLGDVIVDVVDQIGIVAAEADEGIVARAAVEIIG